MASTDIKPEIKARSFGVNIESDLAPKFIRVVENAAIASARTMGRGERDLSDHEKEPDCPQSTIAHHGILLGKKRPKRSTLRLPVGSRRSGADDATDVTCRNWPLNDQRHKCDQYQESGLIPATNSSGFEEMWLRDLCDALQMHRAMQRSRLLSIEIRLIAQPTGDEIARTRLPRLCGASPCLTRGRAAPAARSDATLARQSSIKGCLGGSGISAT